MDQQTELEKVKARIRALAAKTVDRGCSEFEAIAAAEKVGALLDVYGLSMSEVELREETCAQRTMALDDPRRAAMSWLFPALLRFTECRGWTSGRHEFVVFGLEPDVLLAEYLFMTIAGALSYEEGIYRSGPEYAARRKRAQSVLRSFRYGFGVRVSDRLDAMTEARRAAADAARAANQAGTSLVLAKERKIDEGFGALGVKLRTYHRTMTVRDQGAYRRGAAAGGRVGLDRPVGAGRGTSVLPRPNA